MGSSLKLEEMQRTDNVRVVIKPRALNGGPNASARSQMHDGVYFFAAKHGSHRVVLSKIDVANGYVFCKTSNVRVLDLRIVKIIEIVHDDDFMPTSEQFLNQMRPDKAGTACDQDSHGAKLATHEHRWTQILQLRVHF
jgi:hypothetical protein